MPDLEKKRRRCFHRVMSGLERGGEFRFLTLTSSLDAPDNIQASFRKLYYRFRRRNLLGGYVRCPEFNLKRNLKHLHILFRGSYIDQVYLSKLWEKIHRSPIVYAQYVRLRKGKIPVAAYMAKYMSKESAGRYSWNWDWVWKGFAKHWTMYKRWWNRCVDRDGVTTFSNMITGWKLWLHGVYSFDLVAMAQDLPPPYVIRINQPGQQAAPVIV